MGFSISWIAVKGLDKATIYGRMGLSPRGAVGDFVDGNIGAQALPEDWMLIVLDRVEHPLLAESRLQESSARCQVIACNIEEHVMFSSSEAWADGRRLWRIEHAGDVDIPNLRTFGDLPGNFASLERKYRDLQVAAGGDEAGVDYVFEIPLALAHSITGFKHDQTPFEDFELLDWSRRASG